MITVLKKHKFEAALVFLVLIYIVYFSVFTILRYKTLYASDYDLGIMNQTVYNSYRALQTGDFSRMLELTDPTNGHQIKRMAIHNDILLVFMVPFYFIHAGPETLVVIQTIVLALGAFAVYGIALEVFKNHEKRKLIAFAFGVGYLLYTPMERANIFDFHAVTLATSVLLWMIYFWMRKQYLPSILMFVISLFAKEEAGFTTFLFGVYALLCSDNGYIAFSLKKIRNRILSDRINTLYAGIVMSLSLIWSFASLLYIIPHYRGTDHFALKYYQDFGDSPIKIIIGMGTNPYSLFKYIWHTDTFMYLVYLLGPMAFLAIFSPFQLFIALPEFAINLLSSDWNMRNIIFHYTSVIQPFVFFASIYGAYKITTLKIKHEKLKSIIKNPFFLVIAIGGCSLLFSYLKGPLPFTREQDISALTYPQAATQEVALWGRILKNENIKISATGQVAPHFSDRRYLYLFGESYVNADYVLIRHKEVYNYPEKDALIPVYKQLIADKRFKLIYKSPNLEVYKKIQP